jgi:hypothetical protein
MRYLTQYLDQRFNFWRVNIDKKPALTVGNMTLADANRIAESLVGDMSPENISCDGELSRSEVQARYRLYTNAAQELIALFPNLTIPQWDEGLFDVPAPVAKPSFIVGQKVRVNHDKLGGLAVGTVLKVNRVKCRVEFPVKGTFNVPFGMMEKV